MKIPEKDESDEELKADETPFATFTGEISMDSGGRLPWFYAYSQPIVLKPFVYPSYIVRKSREGDSSRASPN